MSVEARLGNAIQDLEGRISEGMEIEAAISQTAEEYYFKEEVLRMRAIKLLGPLETVKQKSDSRIAIAKEKLAFRAAVDAYTVEDVQQSMREWLLQQLGREPSQEELKIAFERSTEQWFAKHGNEFRD